MKIIKKFFLFIAALLVLFCVAILACALNPEWTKALAEKVQELQGEPVADLSGAADGTGIREDWMAGIADNYVAPEKNPTKAPEAVSGLSGYRPVTEEKEQVPKEEADNLSSILATGNLGTEYTFPEEFYPYYAMLEEDMKLLYKQIYANANDLMTSFVPAVTVDVNSLRNVFEAVCNDHPELFWLDTSYSCKYTKDAKCVEITLKYNAAADRLETARMEWNVSAEQILMEARTLGSDAQKEEYVHDVLLRLVEYNENNALGQSAYSAMVKGQSVCAGYARAFQYLMQQLGIPCYYCTGYAGEDHAWNIVKLDGRYVNVDVTWDDTEPATRDYFNKSDAAFSDTHVRTRLSVYLPACVGQDAVASDATEKPGEETPRPTPMTWTDKKPQKEDPDSDLKEAGVTESEIVRTLADYYKKCEKQLIEKGKGHVEFSNVIPETLWSTIEKAYSDGSYKKGYVEAALKEMKGDDFAVQIQAQRLGAGYYRIYHNFYTE